MLVVGSGACTRKSCYGILFFPVTNKGLENRHLIDDQPNSHLVLDLCSGSQYFATLHQLFCLELSFTDSKIVSIFETMETQAVGVSIVPITVQI